jgi:biotin transport system substrate-specific component
MTPPSLFRLVLTALFTALIIVGSYLAIPFIPVPLVLANAFTLLAGLLLGPVYGGAAVLLYLALGALGLPVFAGGSGGFGQFAGPTGGFLVGYLVSAVVAGLVAHGPSRAGARPGLPRLAVAALLGMVALYAVGLPWLHLVLKAKVPTVWAACLLMAPYMLGDAVKVAAAAVLSRRLQSLIP